MPKQKIKADKKKPAKAKSEKTKPRTDVAVSGAEGKGKKTYALLRGMHDVLPREEKYWKNI